jgi:hypothetical protein
VTQETTRKSFLTKVLGLATVGALAPRVVAKSVVPGLGAGAAPKKAAFKIEPQARAVARREGSA